MYMALMSGGQLLQKTRMMALPICPDGCAATYFPEKISDLKANLRTILNKYYGNFDEQTKAVIYNSDVLRSVKGVN
uniref:Uncharacterized protein n=1 Tax=Glossina palpalis gambiensis TaxID=67801 RepID=A0A1B0ATT5_9MUSC